MVIDNILAAIDVLANGHALLLMAVGVAGGLIAGAIPGFTIAMAVVLTLPFTFGDVGTLGAGDHGQRSCWRFVGRPDGRDIDRHTRYAIVGGDHLRRLSHGQKW